MTEPTSTQYAPNSGGIRLAEVIGEANVFDMLPRLLAAAALEGIDIGDLLGHACSEATRQLPRGMELTRNRPGSWEAAHIEGLTDPSAAAEGPGPTALDVECYTCGAEPGSACWWMPREMRLWVALQNDEQATAAACTIYDCDPDDLMLDDGETPRDLLVLELEYQDRPKLHGSRADFARRCTVWTPYGWMA